MKTLSVVPVVLIFISPLVQGGTPRLGTFLIQLCFAALAGAAFLGRKGASLVPAPPDPVEGALFLFLLLAALNLSRVDYYHDAERCFLFILTYVGTFSLLVRLPGERPLAPALSAVQVTAVFQALLALGQGISGVLYQPRGTFDNPNFLAGFLVAGAGLFLADLIMPGLAQSPGRLRRLFGVAGLVVVTAAIIWSRSRGGILALVVTAAALLAIRFGARGLLPVLAGIIALLAVPNPFRERLMSISSSDVYAYSRLSMWQSGLAMFRDHPLLGVGLGQYQFFSPRYAFPVEGHWARYAKVADNPHSEPVMLAAELGLAGLAVLVLFLVAVAAGLRARRGSDGAPRRRPVWPLAILLGLAVQAAVDFSFHSPPVVLASVALLAAWVAAGRSGEDAPVAGQPRGGLLRWTVIIAVALYLLLALRPLVAFSWYLKAGGAPLNLLDEKASLTRWGEGGGPPEEGALRRALFWDSNSAPYHSALGSLAVKRFAATGERSWLERAFREVNTAIALNPNNHRYREHLAELEASLYHLKAAGPEALAAARAHLEAAIALSPAEVFLREKYARLTLEAGDAAAAAREFARATALEPCFLRAWAGQGAALTALGRGAEAGSLYRELKRRAVACRSNPVSTPYERDLIDLKMALTDTTPTP